LEILITGGAGFVGSNLAVFLKNKYPSSTVTAFDNLRRDGAYLNLSRLKTAGVDFVHGDIRSYDDMKDFNPDIVIEASAEPSVLAGLDGGRKYLIDTNLNGAVNALELCAEKGAKMIFLSSSRVYPMEVINGLSYTEEKTRYSLSGKNTCAGVSEKGFTKKLPLDGNRTLYGATKLSAEMLINEYADMFGVETLINRCGVIAGPWQFGKVDQGFVTFWTASYIFDKPLCIFGSGKQVRDILHIHDLCRLIDIQISDFQTFSGKTFNAGGGLKGSVSILETDNFCKKLIKPKEVTFGPERQLDLKYYVTDNSELEPLGFTPEKTAEETITDIYNWITEYKEELRWIFA